MKRLTWNCAVALATIGLAAISLGCNPEDDGRFDPPTDPPGSNPWTADDNVACENNDECAGGEVCEQGVCQMARCTEAFESTPPMGLYRYFGTDGEIAVISDNTFVDGFQGSGSYINSWDLGNSGSRILDVTGGNLMGRRPHSTAAVVEFSQKVKLRNASVSEIDVGFWPTAIATGDVDRDDIDELIAFGEDGSIAICDVELNTCRQSSLNNVVGHDVGVGDVDGDGYLEPVFMLDLEGKTTIAVWNLDHEATGQDEISAWTVNFPARALDVGNVRDVGSADILLLEDGGWWGWTDDRLHVFSVTDDAIIKTQGISGHTMDVAVGDRDSDGIDEFVVLRDDKKFDINELSITAEFTKLGTFDINVGNSAQRISMLDWDGDSASGKLVEGPVLVAGSTVPVAALMFPPYSQQVSDGTSSIFLGSSESTDESYSDTVSLRVGIGLAFGAEAFGFKAKVGGSLEKTVKQTNTLTVSKSIGARFSVNADPDRFGNDYAAVITSCGCYHRYRYQTEDPAGLIGGTGQTVDVFVPIGGQTLLWSSKRYNAMAKSLGTLPEIRIPHRVGDVSSYPAQVLSLDGNVIDESDFVFNQLTSFPTSDVGNVGFRMTVGESETNSESVTTTLGVTSSFGAGVVSVDAWALSGTTQGYSVRVGNRTSFGGGIPPLVDDPNTPEDEFTLNRYTTTPFVYRHHYTDAFGAPAAFYVLNYAAGQ